MHRHAPHRRWRTPRDASYPSCQTFSRSRCARRRRWRWWCVAVWRCPGTPARTCRHFATRHRDGRRRTRAHAHVVRIRGDTYARHGDGGARDATIASCGVCLVDHAGALGHDVCDDIYAGMHRPRGRRAWESARARRRRSFRCAGPARDESRRIALL